MTIAAVRRSWRLAVSQIVSVASASTGLIQGSKTKYRRASKATLTGVVLFLICAIPLIARARSQIYPVTQKGQQFKPGSLTVNKGDTVEILNDDGELIHHAYVDSKTFSFDSGDQEPGSKTDIVFSVPGTFAVLCGIHPKMRMDVVVR